MLLFPENVISFSNCNSKGPVLVFFHLQSVFQTLSDNKALWNNISGFSLVYLTSATVSPLTRCHNCISPDATIVLLLKVEMGFVIFLLVQFLLLYSEINNCIFLSDFTLPYLYSFVVALSICTRVWPAVTVSANISGSLSRMTLSVGSQGTVTLPQKIHDFQEHVQG